MDWRAHRPQLRYAADSAWASKIVGIVQELATAGLPIDTLAAVICDALSAQRTLTGTLQTIVTQAQEQNAWRRWP